MIDNLTKLRTIQLGLLHEFIRVCEEHGLKWYAFYGTLLGAIRDEGFLPWDDDVDVAMPVEDYRKLCMNKKWFGEGYFLQTPLDEGLSNIAKLRKEGTTAFRKNFLDALRTGGHMGIPIDIIPLNEIPGAGCYSTPTLGSVEKKEAVYLKEWFEPAGTVQFEGLTLKAPAKPRKILTEVYDEWAWPLGAQEARPAHWFYDTDTDYKVYVKRYTGMLDGIDGKKIFLFGAADSLRIWLERFNRREQVVCTFDNSSAKWGKQTFGVDVKDPAELPAMLDENSRVIIVSLWHQEIGKQLEKMGIKDYYVYLDFYYDEKVGNKVVRREEASSGNTTIPRWEF
ncbi:MAG: LicD family protein [Lachnospiraceae bacterium]|nr:LicD family protein [Lachnospiraceae bacterium]